MRAQSLAAHVVKTAGPPGLGKWLGRIVKKGFATTDPQIKSEFMWAEIVRVEDNHLVGVLLNPPLYATHLRHGDEVSIDESEIIAVDLDQVAAAEPPPTPPKENN
jgi:hypothetical protein